jgi:hypothetical protein
VQHHAARSSMILVVYIYSYYVVRSPLHPVELATESSLHAAVVLLATDAAVKFHQLRPVPVVRLPGRGRRVVRRPAADADPHHEPDVAANAAGPRNRRREMLPATDDVVRCAVAVPHGAAEDGGLLALDLAEAVEVRLERADEGLEAQRGHGPEQVVAVDGLALLALALVGGLPGHEADELGHALLHRLLGLLGDLGVRRQRLLHDARHVRDGKEPVLLLRRRVAAASTNVPRAAPAPGRRRGAGLVVRRRAAHRAQKVALLALHVLRTNSS